MSDEHRRKILARRNQFIASALAAASAAVLPACDQAQVCLDMPYVCEDETLEIEAPGEACVGDRFDVRVRRGCAGGEWTDVTPDAVLATSDPEVLVVEGSKALARAEGVAELTAIVSGVTTKIEIHVRGCGDAGVDASSSDAEAPDADTPSSDAEDPDAEDPDADASGD